MNILNKTLMIAVGILFTLLLVHRGLRRRPDTGAHCHADIGPDGCADASAHYHGDACSHCHIDTDIGTKSHSDAITHCNTNPGYYGAI